MKKRKKKIDFKRKNRKGFTLIEIMSVVLIISLLAVFVIPKVFTGMGKAKTGIAKSKMAIIESALGRFYLDCNRYPDETEGLNALVEEPSELQEKWAGPYLKKSNLLDPWENAYVYYEEGEINVGSYDIVSLGADKIAGGEGENADIYND